MPQIDFYLIARTDLSVPSPGRRQRTVLYQQGHLQGTLLDFGGRFALEPPRGNQHRIGFVERPEKPVLRNFSGPRTPFWTRLDSRAAHLKDLDLILIKPGLGSWPAQMVKG